MKCKCGKEMEYEEIKYPCGIWHCECGKEYEGERFYIASSYPEIDYEEKRGEEIKQRG